MAEFIVWLAVMSPSYEPIISNALLHKGYTVGAGNNTKKLISSNTITYRLGHEAKSADDVDKDLHQILSANQMLYHLIVVVLSSPTFVGLSRSTNIEYLKNKVVAKPNELDIDKAMADINDLFVSYGQVKLTPEETKRFENKQKNS